MAHEYWVDFNNRVHASPNPYTYPLSRDPATHGGYDSEDDEPYTERAVPLSTTPKDPRNNGIQISTPYGPQSPPPASRVVTIPTTATDPLNNSVPVSASDRYPSPVLPIPTTNLMKRPWGMSNMSRQPQRAHRSPSPPPTRRVVPVPTALRNIAYQSPPPPPPFQYSGAFHSQCIPPDPFPSQFDHRSPPSPSSFQYSEESHWSRMSQQSSQQSHRSPPPPPPFQYPGALHSQCISPDPAPPRPLFCSRRDSFDIHSETSPRIPPPPQTLIEEPSNSPNEGFGVWGHGTRRLNREGRNKRLGVPTPQPEHLRADKFTTFMTSVDLKSSAFVSAVAQSGLLGDKPYMYNALEDMQLRLLRVLPGRKTMIRCEILHVSIENPPPYTAISYAWGDPGKTEEIEVEDSLIPISISLYGALEALRLKNESIMVWADAVCIDQQNIQERSQQVQLMTSIYATAASVAVWLGPEEDDSHLAIDLLKAVADQADDSRKVSQLLSSYTGRGDLGAVVSLFERSYWRRLWVVQEISNAKLITVYCGSSKLPWETYRRASQAFGRHTRDLDQAFPFYRRANTRTAPSPNQLGGAQVLIAEGPASLPDLDSIMSLGERALLVMLRRCRWKIASDAKDKVFGVLGALPKDIRKEFRVDYRCSIKDVYTEVVDYLTKTTECVDVICDAIHFPVHTGSANLPSFVPDWSHIPQNTAMGSMYNFAAGADTRAVCNFLDDGRTRLEISAIYLDAIEIHGTSVGTICTAGDYLMAFLHWRAILLGSLNKDKESTERVQEQFCRTIALGQVPPGYGDLDQWLNVTYHVFASLLHKRLPHLLLDLELQKFVHAKVDIPPSECRQFLQKHFGDRMMGRCFCRTNDGSIGMGAGLMLPGDIVVVPLGCSTPIILRLEGSRGEYRFVGDTYINGYMHGRAVDEWKEGKKVLVKYVLH